MGGRNIPRPKDAALKRLVPAFTEMVRQKLPTKQTRPSEEPTSAPQHVETKPAETPQLAQEEPAKLYEEAKELQKEAEELSKDAQDLEAESLGKPTHDGTEECVVQADDLLRDSQNLVVQAEQEDLIDQAEQAEVPQPQEKRVQQAILESERRMESGSPKF